MRVRGNWISLLSWRAFSGSGDQMERSIGRLSSGYRVNGAGDDAAGMSISQRIRGQFQGLMRANRNALDGISLVQTAEGALGEIHELLHRGRELSVQAANGVLDSAQKASIQTEVEQILEEIDRVVDTTTYNGMRVLAPNGNSSAVAKVIMGLRSGWLEQAEKLIDQHYGIQGDNTTLRVVFENTGAEAAWISGTPNVATGRLDNLTLHINLADFGTVGGPDGGSGPIYNDRKVARALTQAILARNSNFPAVDQWFVSGVADYLVGRDEQLAQDIATYGKQAIIDAMDDVLSGTWKDDNLHRSAAYVAVKYLNSKLAPFSIKDVFAQLTLGNNLDTALSSTYGAGVASFIATDFKINGLAFLNSLNLTDADVGAIGGGDASTVIPNVGSYSESPLARFVIEWPKLVSSTKITLQVGANTSDSNTMTFEIPEVSTYTLGLLGADVTKDATDAMNRFGQAITSVSGMRSNLGTVQIRLEHTVNSNNVTVENEKQSYSRIMDLDVALEMTNLTRQQILTASSGAMLAQSNASRQHVMWLLKGISGGGLAAMGAM